MTLPETMRAIEISEPGGPEVLRPVTRPVPTAASGDVVIKVAWAGVNRPDVLQRSGNYNPPPDASDLPGLEASGEIVAVGADGDLSWLGTQVCALLPGGGYAEYVTTPLAHCLPVPKGFDLRQAACLPETYFTVWSNVFMRGGLTAGQRFLVHGGSSGIGTTAIQLARAFGAVVYATAGTDDKIALCERLGAHRAINYRHEDFVAILKAAGGADLILDMVGGDYLPRNIKALANDGRLQQIAFLQGPKVAVNFAEVMVRRLTISGSTLRPQSVQQKAEIARELQTHVWPLLEAGTVGPVIDMTCRLDDAADAHAAMEAQGPLGKIVLEVAGG